MASTRWRLAVALGSAMALAPSSGCIGWYMPAAAPPGPIAGPPLAENPVLIPTMNYDQVWDQLVDVVDNYFKTEREQRVRLVGDVLTEGRLETYPRTGSTFLEPWNLDSSTPYERLESTLQSIRRRAVVRVIPAEAGFLIDVTVLKELEDLPRPENGLASYANLRNDDSLRRFGSPVGGQQPTLGWIGLGRDVALEQQILAEMRARFGLPPVVAGVPYR